jgi:hypothetical protein
MDIIDPNYIFIECEPQNSTDSKLYISSLEFIGGHSGDCDGIYENMWVKCPTWRHSVCTSFILGLASNFRLAGLLKCQGERDSQLILQFSGRISKAHCSTTSHLLGLWPVHLVAYLIEGSTSITEAWGIVGVKGWGPDGSRGFCLGLLMLEAVM